MPRTVLHLMLRFPLVIIPDVSKAYLSIKTEVFFLPSGCPNDAMTEYNIVRFYTVHHDDTTLYGRKQPFPLGSYPVMDIYTSASKAIMYIVFSLE
jgi:hypothetical protein